MDRPPLTPRCYSTARVPNIKGCLKSPIPQSPIAGSCHARKSVAFGEEVSEEVYLADVWDRTPSEPARKLSYQEVLEFKEIQRSLPRANQLSDLLSGKPASEFLSHVPIGLLPLLAEPTSSPTSSGSSSTFSSPVSSSSTHSNFFGFASSTLPSQPKPPSTTSQWAPPHLAHLLPKSAPPPRPKPNFAFLPLLDTPTAVEDSPYYPSRSRSPSPDPDLQSDTDHSSQDPPTPSLTNASLDSSPHSRASSSSPEPSFLQLPSLRYRDGYASDNDHDEPHYRNTNKHDVDTLLPSMRSMMLGRTNSSSPLPPSPTTAWHAFPEKRHLPASPQRSNKPCTSEHNKVPARRRNVMIVNGIEIDLDDDEERGSSTSESSTPTGNVSLSPQHSNKPLRPPIPVPGSPPSSTRTSAARMSPEPHSPKLSCSPYHCASTGKPKSMSLSSPIRFQRDKGSRQAAKA